ncbi:hypothetical protein GCM10027416_00300 [Okibacterium endophyticum]
MIDDDGTGTNTELARLERRSGGKSERIRSPAQGDEHDRRRRGILLFCMRRQAESQGTPHLGNGGVERRAVFT